MTKAIIGMLLVLAMAAPVSASLITPAELAGANTFVIGGYSNGEFVTTSTTPESVLTYNPGGAGGTIWIAGNGVNGDFGAFSTVSDGFSVSDLSDTLTIDFSTPVEIFALDALPDDFGPAYNVTADFYSPTGALLDSSTASVTGSDVGTASNFQFTGWQFFGAYESSGIGSVVITTNDNGLEKGLIVSDMTVGTVVPEPSTSLLLAAGLFGLGLVSRRRWAR